MTESALKVGAELQRAREARGLALSEVAQQLKFAPRQLEALEQDRFDLLPGGTFARGMVRNYARLLKIDPEPLVRQVGERFEAPDANTLAARYSQPVPFSDNARRSTFMYLGLSLGVLAIGGGVAWQWYHERHRTSAPLARADAPRPATRLAAAPSASQKADRKSDPSPKAKAVEAPPKPKLADAAPKAKAPESAPKAPASAPQAPESPPKAAEPAPKLAQAAVARAAAAPDAAAKGVGQNPAAEKAAETKPVQIANVAAGVHRLVIRCDAEAWIEVRTQDDRALISSLNPAGSERSVRARGPLNLVIGNASHVLVLHNDRPLDLQPYVKSDIARFTLP
ncbi:MAG TPA: RodZ domain-containing protein [Burkholderiales bacterium]